MFQSFFVHKTICQHFICAHAAEFVAQLTLEFAHDGFWRRFSTATRQLSWQFVKAIQPSNFLDDVFRLFDVHAPKWTIHIKSSIIDVNLKLNIFKQLFNLRILKLYTEPLADKFRRNPHLVRPMYPVVKDAIINLRTHQIKHLTRLLATNHIHQILHDWRILQRRLSLIKSCQRIRKQPMAHTAFAHSIHIKRRTLQHDIFRRITHFSVRTAHDARQSDRTLSIRDHDITLIQLIRLAVEQNNRFTRPRHPHAKFLPTQCIIIIRMRWLRRHQHDIICRINHVVDRFRAERNQCTLQPQRTWCDGDIFHRYCHKSRRFFGRIIIHFERQACACRKFLDRIVPVRASKFLPADTRDLARHADLPKTVWAVREHFVFDLDNRIVEPKRFCKTRTWHELSTL